MKLRICKNWSNTLLFTLIGIAFGSLFPIFSTLAACLIDYGSCSLTNIRAVQREHYLLWVIDSAPFFLGIFAHFIGRKQDRVLCQRDNIQKVYDLLEIKNEQMRTEMEAAQGVQDYFLPEPKSFPMADIDYHYERKRSLGGDFLAFHEIDEKTMSFFLGDVSGHGISAALFVALTSSLIVKGFNRYTFAPAQCMKYLNGELNSSLPKDQFLTAIYGILERKTRELSFTFCRGGHPYPLVWRSSSRRVEVIESPGIALGKFNYEEFSDYRIDLEEGDYLFLYTDGVIEQIDPQGRGLENAGLISLLEEICPCDAASREINQLLISALKRYAGQDSLADDALILCIKA